MKAKKGKNSVKAKYELTEEHRAQLGPWADRWIANALNCAPMDDADRSAMRVAIDGLYRAAGLTPPPPERVVFVPSPMVARLAGGFAAAIWWLRANPDSKLARADTYAATYAATYTAAFAAMRDATYAATYAATFVATHAATAAATYDATFAATRAATDAAATHGNRMVRFFLECARSSYSMWNGGNQWSAWCSYISFFRHVAKLDIDYSKWEHYEKAAIHSGVRAMHREFCIVSDRPEFIHMDEENRPHCEDGPFTRWRDGWSIYAVHGTIVPGWIIDTPEKITVAAIKGEQNAEVRRVMRERYGEDRYLMDIGARVIDVDHRPVDALVPKGDAIVRALLEDDEGERYLVGSDGSTRRVYHMRVPNTVETCREAHNALSSLDENNLILEA